MPCFLHSVVFISDLQFSTINLLHASIWKIIIFRHFNFQLSITCTFCNESFTNDQVLLKISVFSSLLLYSPTCQVSLFTFTTYIFATSADSFDSHLIFVSISLFNLLRFPIAMLPMLISSLIQVMCCSNNQSIMQSVVLIVRKQNMNEEILANMQLVLLIRLYCFLNCQISCSQVFKEK